MKIILAIVLLFGVFLVVRSDTSPPSSEENSAEYIDVTREKRDVRFPNGTVMNFPANGNKTWPPGMAPGNGNGMWQGKPGNGTWQGQPGMAQGGPGNLQSKPPQKQ